MGVESFNCPAWTLEEIETLRQEYKADRYVIKSLSIKLGRSTAAIRKKAHRIFKEKIKLCARRWTDDEEQRLCDLITKYSVDDVAKELHRTISAVESKLAELRQTSTDRDGWYTTSDVSLIFGVNAQWIRTRINSGALKARSHYDNILNKENVKIWHIERKDLISFIRKYPRELQGCKVDMVILVDLLTNIGDTD